MGSVVVFLLNRVASLSWGGLYSLSDFLYFIIYRTFKYRRAVVHSNLKNSFPTKTQAEILEIEKEFYKLLCDIIVESIKASKISNKDLKERMTVEISEKYYECVQKKRNVILILGHYANWEYGNIRFGLEYAENIERHNRYVGVYKKVGSPKVDDFLYTMRSKTGTHLAEMKETRAVITDLQEKGIPFDLALVGDQTPSKERGYWLKFLNQPTAVFLGCESYAKRYDAEVFYVDISRKSRGFYHLKIHQIIADPQQEENGAITEKHTKHLEEMILRQPELWLWSHKRWKHKMPNDLKETQISKNYPPKD